MTPAIDGSAKVVIVNGAGGFLGCRVVADFLRRGVRVIALGAPVPARPGLFYARDLGTALTLLPDAELAACVALASASPLADPAEQTAITLGQVLPIMKALEGVCRFVAIGSAAEYGSALRTATALNETHPRSPQSAYGHAKTLLMDQIETVHHQGRDALGLRLFSAVGPHMSSRSLWGAVEAQVSAGKTDIETQSLGGARDILPADEAAAIITTLALAPRRLPPVINVGSGHATPLRPLVHSVLHRHGVALRLAERCMQSATKPDYDIVSDISLLRRFYKVQSPLPVESLARYIVEGVCDV